MAEIRRAVGHVQIRAERATVIHHFPDAIRAEAAEVVHHGEGAPGSLRAFAAVTEHGVRVMEKFRIADASDESLHERAINAELAHPFKMPEHRRVLEGT